MRLVQFLAATAIVVTSLSGHAKTLHVAKWGVDDPTSGGTSQPFLTIGAALMNAGRNDRIVVQPGIYEESLIIDAEGVKLESVAGRHGTIIDATGLGSNVVDIEATKVRLGKKGKGFTLRCDTGRDGVYIDRNVDPSNVRVIQPDGGMWRRYH